ncbi:ArsR family transcriptional regulator [Acidianus sulfidivorans JP7]|uniref:Transcriptional regulator n=1 Tax=Acidianus sulfidivorans JP7 TaxID=619593 RepID=A0A2U9IJK3_9CREN|nr:winged helix-turn-helix domain-containing protein [Acidianus sulfidivorans]AWR96114.1 ArsR family transcriptional regulator [Acidianus sulfidivorans JP7]
MVTIIASDLAYLNFEIQYYTKNFNKAIICGPNDSLKNEKYEVINDCVSLPFEKIALKVAEKISNSKDSYVVLLNNNFNRFNLAMLYLFSTLSKRVSFVFYDQGRRVEVGDEILEKVEVDDKMLAILKEIANGHYKVEEIEMITNISKATVSRKRTDLEKIGLIKKDNGKYCLTERGKIALIGVFNTVKKGERYYGIQTLYTRRQ